MRPEPPKAVERRIVSVLFADLVGFTSLSERLDPEDMAVVQDAYFAGVRETIGRYGGVLEKFIGDAAMAVFGVPRARDDDAERAVRAGLALVNVVDQLQARLGVSETDARGGLRLRVGVNSGEVVYATEGADEGRVTGDTVNLAARLQTATDPNTVLLGELTALAVEETIELEPIGELALKGKEHVVRAWRAIGPRPEPSRDAAMGTLHAPLLARDAELARLADALATHAAARSAGRWVIVAPPGVGKSRLLAEFATMARRSATVLRARLRPQIVAPYEAVAQLLRDALGDASDPQAAFSGALARAGMSTARREVVMREALLVLRPPLATHSAADASVQDVGAERDARFAAWIEMLDALAGSTPSVWVVEDVHWAGGDLLAFLSHAAAAPTAAGRLIVASARPSLLDSAPAWCAETAGPASPTVLELPPLVATNATELVHALVGPELPDELVRGIVERSDGNPLFIEELLRTWISVGTLVRADGRWRLAVDPGQVTLPATVQAIYAAQLDDLPADARLVARRASVAGRRFADAALEPLELAPQRDGLETLRRRAFVAGPQVDPLSGDVYSYRHALLRDVGYASLARAERARLHAALARWLEDTSGDRSDELAESIGDHYAQSLASLPAIGGPGGLDRDELSRTAAAWLERGAQTSLRMAAHDAGRRLLQRAVELTPPDAPLDLARRRLRIGEVMAETADLEEGIAELGAALAVFGDHLDGDDGTARIGFAAAAHALGQAHMQHLEFHLAEEGTTSALKRLEHGGTDDAPYARLAALHAWTLAAQGRSEGVREEIEHALGVARRLGDAELELDILERRAASRGEIAEFDHLPMHAEWDQIQRRAVELGRWRQAVIAMRVGAVPIGDEGPRDALPILDAAADLAHAHGLTEQLGWCDLARCETRFIGGDWDDAWTAGERAIAVAERYAYVRLAFRTWMVLLPMAAAAGRVAAVDRFEVWWNGAIAHFPPSPSPYGATLRETIPLWVARARGKPPGTPPSDLVDVARQSFSNPHFLAAVETLVRVWLEAGDTDSARGIAVPLLTECAGTDATPLMRTSAALIEAWLAFADGDARSAAGAARRAMELSRGPGFAWWTARAIRAVEAAGAADSELLAEAAALESALGIDSELPPVSGATAGAR